MGRPIERVMDQVNTRYGKIRPNQIKKFFLIKFLFFDKKCSENKILVKKNFMKNFISNFLQTHLSLTLRDRSMCIHNLMIIVIEPCNELTQLHKKEVISRR